MITTIAADATIDYINNSYIVYTAYLVNIITLTENFTPSDSIESNLFIALINNKDYNIELLERKPKQICLSKDVLQKTLNIKERDIKLYLLRKDIKKIFKGSITEENKVDDLLNTYKELLNYKVNNYKDYYIFLKDMIDTMLQTGTINKELLNLFCKHTTVYKYDNTKSTLNEVNFLMGTPKIEIESYLNTDVLLRAKQIIEKNENNNTLHYITNLDMINYFYSVITEQKQQFFGMLNIDPNEFKHDFAYYLQQLNLIKHNNVLDNISIHFEFPTQYIICEKQIYTLPLPDYTILLEKFRLFGFIFDYTTISKEELRNTLIQIGNYKLLKKLVTIHFKINTQLQIEKLNIVIT